MNPSVDESVIALTGLLSFVFLVALYVWSALALSAMFRKMGEEPWKGWVPFLNMATVLKWGGFSPWLVLLVLIPGFGAVALWVLLVLSAHRINPGFGYGAGMTVVAALVFVIWASILGFGPARWLGARAAVRPAPATPPPPPAPALPTARQLPFDEAAASGIVLPAAPPAPAAPALAAPELDEAAAASFAPPLRGAAAWTPPDTSPRPATPPMPVTPASAAAERGRAAAETPPTPAVSAVPAPAAAAVPATPATPRAAAPEEWPRAASDPAPVDDNVAWPSEIDDVSAIYPSPYPPSSAAGRAFVVPPVGGDEVGPIAFVPGRRTGAASTPEEAPVTRVPEARAAEPAAADAASAPGSPLAPTSAIFAQPAPVRRTFDVDDPDAFPELSGEVSAVVGSPTAGMPRSAIAAVSAQHRRADEAFGRPADEVPDSARAGSVDLDDDFDETIIARRIARPTWELVPVSGSPIPLTASVVILGRRPSGDPAFPTAQLVAVQDDARTVSKTHARIEQRGETWTVTDLGSTNGVLVRTLMGDEVELEAGGQVDAGERFFLGDEEFHLRHITG